MLQNAMVVRGVRSSAVSTAVVVDAMVVVSGILVFVCVRDSGKRRGGLGLAYCDTITDPVCY